MNEDKSKYVPLTLAFGGLFLVFPLSSVIWDIHVTEVFLLAIVLVAIFAIETKQHWQWLGVLLAVPSYGVLLFGVEGLAPRAHATAIFLYVIAWRAIVLDILYRDHITPNVVFGAIVVYCIIGVVWGHLFALIDLFEEGQSFTFEGRTAFDYFYFSYVTLTTVGYGDTAPVTPLAKGFAITEAVLGQIFLAVFIARLIGRISHEPISKQ